MTNGICGNTAYICSLITATRSYRNLTCFRFKLGRAPTWRIIAQNILFCQYAKRTVEDVPPPLRHPERREAESNSRRAERAARPPRARRSQTAEGSKKRFLLACFEISNIVLGFSYASRQRRFRSRARALFTLLRVNKVRLRTGLLSHRSSIITLLCSAQNDAYRVETRQFRLPRVVGDVDPYKQI